MESRHGTYLGLAFLALSIMVRAGYADRFEVAHEARNLRETGRPLEAEVLLRNRLSEEGESAALLAELGEALLDTGRRAEAFETFRKAGAVEATEAGDVAARAAAFARLGREDPQHFRDALRLYDEAVAADPADLDVQVALGDLFLDRYNAQDARETYEKVLATDPKHAGALLGMARVKRFDGATDAFELTESSLEQDPELVGARVLLARQYLDLEDYDAADREAERALEVNPRSARAHAVVAASALLSGRRQDFERRLERAEEATSNDPEVFVTLAEVAARRFLYAPAVTFADRAVELDGMAWRGWALRGVNRLRTGEIEAGRRDLETAFAGDPFDVWTKNTLDLLDQMADYEVTATKRFELVIPAAEADLLALYLGPLAEQAHDRLSEAYGIALPAPVRIEVFPRHADFSVRTIGLVGLGALGVCFGPVIALDAPSARAPGDFHWGTTFWHELAHSFHLQLSAHRVPRWFTEGLAVFEERRARPGWGDRASPDFLIAYKQDRLAPVEDLNQGFMRPAYPRQIVFSYLQASLVFDYVDRRWGFPSIVAMLEAYRDGKNTPEVFVDVLGIDLEAFAKAYDQDFRERFSGPLAALKPSEEAPSPEDYEQRADRDPDDFLAHLAAGRSRMGEDDEAALRHLQRAKDLFPTYAGMDSPYWWSARIHEQAGRLEEAHAELVSLSELNQAHYPALQALARLRTELGDDRGATQALADAIYVHPYDEELHAKLAQWYTDDGQADNAVQERRALLALDPFNRPDALYQLALAQRAAGDRKAARSTVLEALEQAPNFDEALTLLLELRAESGESP